MAGRFNLANQLRYLQWISVCLLVLIILEKLFALLSVAYGVLPPSTLVSDEAQLVRDHVFFTAIMVIILLWCGLEYVWAAYEVFPSFVFHESGVEDSPYAIWGVIFTMLLQLANAAFIAQAFGYPIADLKDYATYEQNDTVLRAINTSGAWLFLLIITVIGFVLQLIVEGILIANRKYWFDQNPPAEPKIYYEPYYVPQYVPVTQLPNGQFVQVAGVPIQGAVQSQQPIQTGPVQVQPAAGR